MGLLPRYTLNELERQIKDTSAANSSTTGERQVTDGQQDFKFSRKQKQLVVIEGEGDYIAKQDVTLWDYSVAPDGSQQLKPSFVKGNSRLEVKKAK